MRGMLWFLFAVSVLWAGIALSQETAPFLAERHQQRGLTCVSCHNEAEPKTAASGAACLKCHKSLEAVADRTKDFEKNPHSNHITQVSDVECTQCHNGHKEIAPLCHQCHAGMTFGKSEAETK